MRSKSLAIEMVLLGIALFIAMRGFGIAVGEQEASDVKPRKSVKATPEDKKEIGFDLGRGVKMELVRIRPGSFMMGDEKGDSEEKPVHKVTISKPFYLGKFEVTQEQWEAVMGGNPSHFKGAESRGSCQLGRLPTFIKKLNEKFARLRRHLRPADRGGVGIRLPRGINHAIRFWRQRIRACQVRLV